jgi:hypothetical protein
LIRIVSEGATLVAYAAASGRPLAVDALGVIGKNLTVRGFVLGHFR